MIECYLEKAPETYATVRRTGQSTYIGEIVKEHLTEVFDTIDELIDVASEVDNPSENLNQLIILREMLELCSTENESRLLSALRRLTAEGKWTTPLNK